jgi:hypothetical protein
MEFTTDPRVFLADLLARLSGPGVFRFVLQPLVAVFLGIRDGVADAKAGRPPYLWGLLFHQTERRAMLHHGAGAIVKPLVVAIVVDAVLSYVTMGAIYPGQTLLVGIFLVAIPYTLARAAANRVVRHRRRLRHAPGLGGSDPLP